MQCLAKDPDERPADADAMVEALIDCVQAVDVPPAARRQLDRRGSCREL
jgi:hypothetical protein